MKRLRKWFIRHFKPSPKFEEYEPRVKYKKVDFPEQTIFQDGNLKIIYHGRGNRTLCAEIYMTEYDKPLSLQHISNVYKGVEIVIFETGLHGQVYRCGNHAAGEWELVGETVGYA